MIVTKRMNNRVYRDGRTSVIRDENFIPEEAAELICSPSSEVPDIAIAPRSHHELE